MVAGFQDDLDLEDKPPSRPLLSTGPVSRENATLPSEAAALASRKCPEPGTKQYVGLWGEGLQGEGQTQTPDHLLSQRPSAKALRPHRRTAPRAAEPRRPPAEGSSLGHEDRKGEEPAASSESDPEGPIAAQMLSFVMDDPDFESDLDVPPRVVRNPEAASRTERAGGSGGLGDISLRPEPGRPHSLGLSAHHGDSAGVSASWLPHVGIAIPLTLGQVRPLKGAYHLPGKWQSLTTGVMRRPPWPAPPGRVPSARGPLRRDRRGHWPCPAAPAPQGPHPILQGEG